MHCIAFCIAPLYGFQNSIHNTYGCWICTVFENFENLVANNVQTQTVVTLAWGES